MNGEKNGNNLENGGNNGQQQPKKGLKAILDGLHRKYDAFRYSKTGKWIARGLTAATIIGTGKVCYDKGKASVKPTIVTIEKIPDEDPATEEAPAEEAAEEQTV